MNSTSFISKMKKQSSKKHYQTFRENYDKLKAQLANLPEIPQMAKLNLRLLKAQTTIYAGVHDDNYEQFCKAVATFEKTANEFLLILKSEEEQGYEQDSCFRSEDANYQIKFKEDDRFKVKATYTPKITTQTINYDSFKEYAKRKTEYYKGLSQEFFHKPYKT